MYIYLKKQCNVVLLLKSVRFVVKFAACFSSADFKPDLWNAVVNFDFSFFKRFFSLLFIVRKKQYFGYIGFNTKFFSTGEDVEKFSNCDHFECFYDN